MIYNVQELADEDPVIFCIIYEKLVPGFPNEQSNSCFSDILLQFYHVFK